MGDKGIGKYNLNLAREKLKDSQLSQIYSHRLEK